MTETSKYISDHRRETHKSKNLFKGDELRRRREEQQIEIRKQKRDENLAKRRNLNTLIASGDDMDSDIDEESSEDEKVCDYCVVQSY